MKIKIIRSKKHSPLAKAFAEPFSLEGEVEFRKLIVVEELLQFMKREGINRSELAARMGVPPSRITKMLSGDSNLTIDTLVRAGRAVGADLHQTFAPVGKKIRWTSYDPVDVHEAFVSPVRTIAVEPLNGMSTLPSVSFAAPKPSSIKSGSNKVVAKKTAKRQA